jgi:hypothetical protein
MESYINKYFAVTNDPDAPINKMRDELGDFVNKFLTSNPNANPLEIEALMIGEIVTAVAEYKLRHGMRLRSSERNRLGIKRGPGRPRKVVVNTAAPEVPVQGE